MSAISYIGRGLLMVGAVLTPVGLSLHIEKGLSATAWRVYGSTDVVVTAIAAAVVILVLLSFFFVPKVLAASATGCALFLLGSSLPESNSVSFYGPGFWVVFAGAVVAVVGGVLASVGLGVAGTSQTSLGSGPSQQPPPAQPQLPPPGWYPDPQRPGGMRWWDGTVWTPQTQ